MKDSTKQRLDKLLTEVNEIIQSASDADIPELLGDGALDAFLKAIVTPKTDKKQSIYDYLLASRNRLGLMALVRLAIHKNYSIRGKLEDTGHDVFVSPFHIQWYEDGVMFVQGKERFEGAIGLYQDGQVKFANSKRDIRQGEDCGPEDIDFVAVEELKERIQHLAPPTDIESLEQDLAKLEDLLRQKNSEESTYHEYLTKHPWLFSAQYKCIDSHKAFDDENIPDFTGVRVHDSARN